MSEVVAVTACVHRGLAVPDAIRTQHDQRYSETAGSGPVARREGPRALEQIASYSSLRPSRSTCYETLAC
jgi:hypothetical protein